ncbi:sensor histidine kinase [Larkinella ripae]
MPPFNDTRLRLVGPLVLFLFGSLFFRIKMLLGYTSVELGRYCLVGITAGYVCWNLTRWLTRFIQRNYPGLSHTRHRLGLLLLALPFLINFGYFIRQFGHSLFTSQPGISQSYLDSAVFITYIETIGIQIFYHFVYLGIYEGSYLFNQWQKTNLEKESLLRTQWQGRFEVLKNQVNPHFLFNSLNTLSSLISENPDLAEAFVDDMASVYRYLLQSNDRELTTLRRELEFIDSYYHLLKTRYGSALFLEVSVSEDDQEAQLPPLTLQMLVENAVKHNLMLPEQPLRITIDVMDGFLRIRNGLQRKNVRVESNHVGLSNIASKYKLLALPSPSIEEKDGFFEVSLPLLDTKIGVK